MSIDGLLDELRATFPVGQASGTFAAASVRGGEYVPLLNGAGFPATLELSSETGWTEQRDGSIRLDGTLTTRVLGVAGAPVQASFSPSGRHHVLRLVLRLPADWTFAQSFPALAGTTLAELTLDPEQPATLTLSSDPGQARLAFAGTFTRSSPVIGPLAWLLHDEAPLRVGGPLDYDAKAGTLDMALRLAGGTAGDLFGESGPALSFELALWSGLDAVSGHYAAGVRFTTTVDFGRTIALEALLESSGQGILDLTLTGSALDFPDPAVLARYFGHDNGIAGALPDQFSGGSFVQVTAVRFGVGLTSRSLEYAELRVGALRGRMWKVWPGVIELGDLQFIFQIFQPMDTESRAAAFTVAAHLTLGDTVPLIVQAQLPGEVLMIGLDRLQPPPTVAALLQHVFGETFGFGEHLLIDQLALSADVKAGIYSGTIEVGGELSFEFGIDNTITFEDLTIDIAYAEEDGPSGDVAARFAVGANEFAIGLAMTKGNTVFRGEWTDHGEPLTYQDIAIALGLYGLPDLPEELQLELSEASFEFDSAGPSLAFELSTATGGGAAMIAGKSPQGAWGFVFGMILSLEVSVALTDIDVVGKLVPPGYANLALSDLRVVGATKALPRYESTAELERIIGPAVTSGLALSSKLSIGTELEQPLSIRFGGADDNSELDVPPARTSRATLLAARDAAPAPQATWVTIARAFGPVQIQRIGFALADGAGLSLLVDGSVSLAGLTVGLQGLEGTVPLRAPYVPTFDLAGLQVSFVGAGVQISGGLERVPGRSPVEYSGELSVVAANFGLTALGSYTTAGGQPSLFAFLVLDAPLGGPPFFFVTGLAGGFGYNRSLRLPAIDEVASFPLVAGATGRLDPRETEKQLNERISPAPGEDWLAAGVTFTSFEIVRSFALLTVAFGAHVEIALLGEATISVPPAAKDDKATPTAQAQMVLLADLDPANGQLAVSAQLTPESYVLDRAARLTGGFAFYSWFAPSRFAGDFVVTLGGYNPSFAQPDHYPKPPRLGLDWRLSDQLEIKGGLYFALTPSVVMAGGTLQATWHSGDLNAWFDAHADFLIRFKPFAYQIGIGVTVGVSLTLNLLVTTMRIAVQVGVDVTLWGPPFGGRAHIDLSVVSFTIGFGEQRQPPPKVEWDGFRQSFLPAANATERAGGPRPPARPAEDARPTGTDTIITLAAAQGLLGRHESVWVVDPAHVRIEVATLIPSTTASVTSAGTSAPTGDWSEQLGIGPMDARPGSVKAELQITLARAAGEHDRWRAAAVTGKAPAGLWQNTTNTMQGPSLVEHALTGVSLIPAPADGPIRAVPRERLSVAEPTVRRFRWSAATAPDSDTFDQAEALAAIARTPVDVGVLAALRTQGLTTAATVNVEAFARNAADLLAGAPQLRRLGEEVPA